MKQILIALLVWVAASQIGQNFNVSRTISLNGKPLTFLATNNTHLRIVVNLTLSGEGLVRYGA